MWKILLFPISLSAILTGCFSSSDGTDATATPLVITYHQSLILGKKGVPIAPDTATSSGGNVTGYALSGGSVLPAGLNLNATSGLLSGTPSVAAAVSDTFIATGSAGTGKAVVVFTIVDTNPAISYKRSAITGTKGTAITPDTIVPTGGAVTGYALSGGSALPAGLNLNATSGLISGTPTVAVTTGDTIIATGPGGTGKTIVTLTLANAVSGNGFNVPYSLFDSTVQLTKSGNNLIIQSNGIPNHKSPYFAATDSRYEADTKSGFAKNPNSISSQNLTFTIPMSPVMAATHQSTSLGPIGVALNGVPLYNQYAGPNQPLTSEIYSFDQYNGHPQQTGQYHYHVEPYYLTAHGAHGESSLIGFLLDGFPVYGPQENGVNVTDSSLDVYHGHFSATPEYPNGIYHYHTTATSPYINGGQYYGTPGSVTQ